MSHLRRTSAPSARLRPVFVGAAAIGLVAITAWLALGRGGPALGASEPSRSNAPQEGAVAPGMLQASLTGSDASAPPPRFVPGPPQREVVRMQRGRVVGLDGRPLGGVRLLGCEDGATIEAGADGVFVLPASRDVMGLRPADDGWAVARIEPAADVVELVVAPVGDVDGVVLDDGEEPVEGACVRVRVESGSESALVLRTWLAVADAEGAFSVPRCALGPGVTLEVAARGFAARALPLDAGAGRGLRIALERLPVAFVDGIVVDRTGGPVAGARVCLGDAQGRTGEDGAFELPLGDRSEDGVLCVAAEGHAPALVDLGSVGIEGRVTVRLGPPRTLRARIVDHHGSPCADWCVAIADPTPLAGQSDRVVEDLLGERRVVTDPQGRFALEGLLDRPYALRAWGPGGQAAGLWGAVELLPREQELVVAELAADRVVKGVVVDGDGRPVAGARLGERRHGWQTPMGSSGMRFEQRVETDRQGRFVLTLSAAGLEILVDGDAIVPARHVLPDEVAEDVRVRVERRRNVRVSGEPDELAELSFAAVGASGAVTEVVPQFGDLERGALWIAVAEGAQTLVVRRGGREVARLKLESGARDLDLAWSGGRTAG